MNISQIETFTRFLTKTNTTSLKAPELLILENKYYEEITGRIITETAGSKWLFGDSNYTAFPNYTIDLTNSEPTYSLRMGTLDYDAESTAFTAGLVLTGGTSKATARIEIAQDDGATGTLTLSDIDGTFKDNETITDSGSGSATVNGLLIDSSPLIILGVEILDVDGNYYTINPISFQEIRSLKIAQSEYRETDGRPAKYEKRENRIVLYPAPDDGVSVTLADGLKVFYLRTADIFTSAEQTTGAKVPGFPSPWHDLLSYGPAYDVAITNGLPNANHFKLEYDNRMKEMLNFISRRNQDDRNILKTLIRRFR